MRYVLTAEEMRALDRATIDEVGLPGIVLMENAGRAVAEAVSELLPPGGLAVVVCGTGNNGGDGWVIARCLHAAGSRVTALLAGDASKIRGDAALHRQVYDAIGGVCVSIADAEALALHGHLIDRADVLVDAVFGTGLDRQVQGHYRAVLTRMARCPGRRVAVDLPSGLRSDTGEVLGVCVAADVTITMGFLKIAQVSSPGFLHCGDVRVADIGIPPELARRRQVRAGLYEVSDACAQLPPVRPTDHKGSRGHALVVAGSPGKRGAARLSAWAALRGGAGVVTLASAGDEPDAPDPVMTAAIDMGREPLSQLRTLASGKQALAMGPGMPTDAGGRSWVLGALAELTLPMVLDADALNHLGSDLNPVAAARAPVVLTPHPGEAARLLACSTADIEADRFSAVRRLASAARAVVVLKGARTLVCDGPEGVVSVNPTASAALATAGAGDVLTGMVAAMLAQGASAADAARVAVYVHGRAGELAGERLGDRSVTASDLIEAVPLALRELDARGDEGASASAAVGLSR